MNVTIFRQIRDICLPNIKPNGFILASFSWKPLLFISMKNPGQISLRLTLLFGSPQTKPSSHQGLVSPYLPTNKKIEKVSLVIKAFLIMFDFEEWV